MKPKFIKINVLILTFGFCLSSVAQLATFANSVTSQTLPIQIASGGGIHGGGGDGIKSSKGVVFRDLVETPCQWVPASEFAQQLTELPTILGRIEKLNFYLPSQFKEQIKKVSICPYEGALTLLNTEDAEKLTVYEYKNGERKVQLGIRFENKVWISMPYFKSLKDPRKVYSTDELKAYFFLHELSHGLIPMEIYMRNEKVKAFVAALATSSTTENLEYQMKMNEVQFIPNSNTLFKRAIAVIRSGKFGAKGNFEDDPFVEYAVALAEDKFTYYDENSFMTGILPVVTTRTDRDTLYESVRSNFQSPFADHSPSDLCTYIGNYSYEYMRSSDQQAVFTKINQLINQVNKIHPKSLPCIFMNPNSYYRPSVYPTYYNNVVKRFVFVATHHPKLISLFIKISFPKASEDGNLFFYSGFELIRLPVFKILTEVAYTYRAYSGSPYYYSSLEAPPSQMEMQNAKTALELFLSSQPIKYLPLHYITRSVAPSLTWFPLTPIGEDFAQLLRDKGVTLSKHVD